MEIKAQTTEEIMQEIEEGVREPKERNTAPTRKTEERITLIEQAIGEIGAMIQSQAQQKQKQPVGELAALNSAFEIIAKIDAMGEKRFKNYLAIQNEILASMPAESGGGDGGGESALLTSLLSGFMQGKQQQQAPQEAQTSRPEQTPMPLIPAEPQIDPMVQFQQASNSFSRTIASMKQEGKNGNNPQQTPFKADRPEKKEEKGKEVGMAPAPGDRGSEPAPTAKNNPASGGEE